MIEKFPNILFWFDESSIDCASSCTLGNKVGKGINVASDLVIEIVEIRSSRWISTFGCSKSALLVAFAHLSVSHYKLTLCAKSLELL